MHYIKFLSECGKDDLTLIGGKAAALAELMQIGVSVPPGFAITTSAYRDFVHQSTYDKLRDELYRAFQTLRADTVVVRSSAIMEDSAIASWAGQLESYLNIAEKDLMTTVLKCWDSLNSKHAQAYQKQSNTPDDTLAIGVIVQKLIYSDISGVCFTANPVSGNKNEMIIEACRGLGELLVQGKITPENYVIRTSDAHVVSHTKANQRFMLTITNGQLHEIPVDQEKTHGNILSASQRTKIVETAIKIEGHFGKPQDIEWAIEGETLFIVQSRPITTLSE